jgi:hypothetical protein
MTEQYEVQRSRRFLRGFIVSLGLAFTLTILTNLIIDPFGRFDFITVSGLNALRPQAGNHSRLSKLAIVCRDKPEAVVIGTSRIALGIDPLHPGWGTAAGHVYNLGMPGMGLQEAALTLQHAVNASGQLRLAVVGLDFLMFNANREALAPKTENVTFDRQRFVASPSDSCVGSFVHDLDWWLGFKGLSQSVATIWRQMPETQQQDPKNAVIWLSLTRRDGLMDNAPVFESRARLGGYRALFGDGAQERYYASVVWLPPPDRSYCFSRNGLNTFEVFRQMIRFARRADIDLRLFLDPIHARLQLALQEAGLLSTYEQWKRRLVQIVAEEARESGDPAIPLWDFSSFNEVTTEPVPPPGDVKTSVKWFWEPAHYKKDAGNLILDRILDYAPRSVEEFPADFGILLTPENIDHFLANDREKGIEYRRRESDDAILVRNVVNAVMRQIEPIPCQAPLAN